MVARVPVSLAGKPYESIVGNEILSRTGEFVREILPAGSCAVVTDSNVGPRMPKRSPGRFKELALHPLS
jgi:hypothetical protein